MSCSRRHALAAVVLCSAFAAPAAAAADRPPLIVVGHGGSIERVPDTLPADLPEPAAHAPSHAGVKAAAATRKPKRPFTDAVNRMLALDQIDGATAKATLDTWNSAIRARRRLRGGVAAGLGGAIDAISGIASRGSLTRSRLPLLTLTAKRNTEYFTAPGATLPSYGQRVRFKGSDLVWQYYDGQGLQLQQLASFGSANGLWQLKSKPRVRRLLDELVSLMSKRSGGVAFEYAFSFGGGSPPWASGMTQATAVQALSRGSALLADPKYEAVAARALPLFDHAPPSGVRVTTSRGPWYVMYSYDPSLRILNGFLQSLIGLDEMRDLTSNPVADRLFEAADPTARAAVPRYRSSGWSYYVPGEWDTLDYHSLTTGFLEELCRRTFADVYCSNGRAFRSFLDNPPRLKIVTRNLRQGSSGDVHVWVSKPTGVTLRVTDAGGKVVAVRSDWIQPGPEYWTIRVPKGTTPLTATLSARDAGGHSSSVTAIISRH